MAVACCFTLSMCLSSYIGWQMESPVNCVENAIVLGLKLLGFLFQGLGQGDSAGRVRLNDDQSYMHPVKY